jgi:hypothetical protein
MKVPLSSWCNNTVNGTGREEKRYIREEKRSEVKRSLREAKRNEAIICILFLSKSGGVIYE